MQKESISSRQGISILIMFLFGSSVIMGVSTEAGQDGWFSLLLAVAFFIPVALVYARIMRLYPKKDIFEIMETALGKPAGKILTVLLSLYAVHLSALVLRNFSEFIQVIALPKTPQLTMMIGMLLVTVYLARSGAKALGRWSLVAIILVLAVVVFTVVFSIDRMRFEHIQPVLVHDLPKIASGAFNIFSFPFAESVLLLGIASAIKKKDSPYKLYIFGALLGAAVLLVVILRNLFVLGPAMLQADYFPSYTAARIVRVADFLSRIEGSISMNLILAGIVKITLCLLAASKGTARLIGLEDYRQIVLPVGLIVLALCTVLYKNIMEMFDFVRFYPYYALPFQVILPILVWIAAEIRTRKQKNVSGRKIRKVRMA